MPDDTTSVVLNGITIFAANDNPVGGYPLCSTQPTGCVASTAGRFDLTQLGQYVKLGVNTLSFTVEQKNGAALGLDYDGQVSTQEPASLGCIGLGLAGLGLLARRRTRAQP